MVQVVILSVQMQCLISPCNSSAGLSKCLSSPSKCPSSPSKCLSSPSNCQNTHSNRLSSPSKCPRIQVSNWSKLKFRYSRHPK